MATLPSALVVPVDLEALCVGETDVNGSSVHPYGTKDFARLAPDFSLLPYADGGNAINPGPYTSDQVLTTAFQPASQPLGVGVHLHWALPQSLAHGAQGPTGKIEFPAAPNRWLVMRIASNTKDASAPVTAMNAWVIESDRLWDKHSETLALPKQNAISLDVPIKPIPTAASNKSFKTLGRAFPYADWVEDTAAERAKLTALGFGEVHFAATYEYCANVFGLWDTLEDLDSTRFPAATTRLSYLLVGWHADIADDPLAKVTYPVDADQAKRIAAIQHQLKWALALAPGAPLPNRTIYSALMTQVPWDKSQHYIEPHTPSSDLEIAVGNTGAEAVSALLAAQQDLKSLPNVEFVLNALQAGLLSRLSLPGGLADIDEVLHQKAFASTIVGNIWVITPDAAHAKQGIAITPEAMLASSRNLAMTLPAGVGDELNALNEAQGALDRAIQDVESLRARIFADWYRYMSIEYATDPGPISPNAARTFIQSEIAELKILLADVTSMQSNVDDQVAALRKAIGTDYTLDTSNGPRYWNPSNPVVLFSGTDVRPSNRVKMAAAIDAQGNLICRTGTDILSAMTADNSTFTIHADNLPKLSPAGPSGFSDIVPALVGEAFFADAWQAPVLAAAVAALGGAGNPAQADYAGLVTAIAAAQQAKADANEAAHKITFVGTPGPPGSVKRWNPPWIPIILQWRTSFYANSLPPYDADFILQNYEPDDSSIDLKYKGKIPVDPQNARTYQGTIVLSSNTEIDLAQQIKTYLANFPDDDVDGELKAILDGLDLSAQAQALSGFNQAFLMLDHVLQMEVSDPLAILQGLFFSRFTNQDTKDAVGTRNVDSPRGNNTFCPVRNGAFSIDRLRVIDAFGQVLDLQGPSVIRAQSLIASGDTSGLLNLPVRLVQAAQLRFNWLSAADDRVETNSDPATTPVIGWVLYNHLDNALAVYDTSGNAIGSFNMLGPFWQGAPGNTADYGKPIETAFASANPHLRDFALALAASADPVGYLGELLAAIDGAVSFISPRTYKQDSGLSPLIGRPIALVRAALKLDLMGLPAMDQSMSAFGSAIGGDDVLDREVGQVPQLRVPVRLGELADIDDGMVGYFIEKKGEASSYQTFYSPAAKPGNTHGVTKPDFGQVVVIADRAAPPVLLTFLVDPHASVHATTGLLPMKELTIPPAIIADDLANMAVTFLTSPFLSSGPPDVPVPEEGGFVWNWVTQQRGAAGWTVEPVQSASAAISAGPRRAVEGWLSLSQDKKS
ncbi:MAG: hypothetical protein QOD09_754 [Bradyrhizobium sp.]|jgi:hypothetical protein|nr:hypothetical protein [Bradyrhizobium sp.]